MSECTPSSNSHLSPPTEFARGRYGWPDLFWATGDMPYNQAMAWSEHHRSRSQHFERMLQLRAADEPKGSRPCHNDVRTNTEILRSMLDFAYEHGYHEVGYDPLAELIAQLRRHQPPSTANRDDK